MKAHLTILLEPTFHEGEDYFALCDVVVPRAHAEFMWTDQILEGEPPVSTLLVCRKCLMAAINAPKTMHRKYFYGLLAGEEIKQEMAAL